MAGHIVSNVVSELKRAEQLKVLVPRNEFVLTRNLGFHNSRGCIKVNLGCSSKFEQICLAL